MRPYEVMYVLRPDLEEEHQNSLIERFNEMVTNQGGTIESTDIWGKRRLAYEVQGLREGCYVLLKINGGPSVASELDRVFKITDEVVRHAIVRLDK